MERAGEAIASAGGAVIIAFLALMLSSLGIFQAIGPALAIAVAVTLLAGLTLVPAVVTLLGRKLFWPSKTWTQEPKGARFERDRRLAWAGGPACFAAVSGLILAVPRRLRARLQPDASTSTPACPRTSSRPRR